MDTKLRVAPLIIVVALGGCVAAHDITPDASTTPPTRDALVDCTELEVLAGSETLTIGSGDHTSVFHGSWVRLSHPANAATDAVLEVLSIPSGADSSTFRAGAHFPTSGWPEGPWGRVDSFGLDSTGPVVVPLYSPEQDVFLQPTGTRFRFRVCPAARPSFPVCRSAPPSSDTVDAGMFAEECEYIDTAQALADGDQHACACQPPCGEDVARCPAPDSGDATVACVHGRCVLPCDESTVCPDGQACVASPDFGVPAMCMTLP